nr:Transposase, MuDR, plant [Ipomoea batatas]
MDNCSTLRAANLARRYGKIDIYADHGIQEAELVPNLFLPSSAPECDDGVITQPEKEVAAECENNCEADDEPTDDSDAEDSCDPFLSDDDDEVRAARKFGTQQAEEDIDGAGNSPNDEDIHGAENTDNEEGMQQNGGDNGGCEDMDQAAFGEDYDSDDPPSYHTDNEDNLNDVGDHSSKCKFPSYNPQAYPPVLEAGLLFEDSKQFKQAIIAYAVYTKRDLRFTKNEASRVRVKCVENCPFYCCGRWEKSYHCFQLRRIANSHRCNTELKLGIVTQKWLEDKYEDC